MAKRRPLIGVLAISAKVPFPSDPTRVTLVPTAYLEAISASGGEPALVPVGADPETILERVDGVMLLGGSDIDPARYGAARHPATGAPSASRDESELALVTGAVDRGLPVLGICRGAQLMNVARGGTLVQHLPDLVGENVHSSSAGPRRHAVRAVARTRLASLIGTDDIVGISTHHQAVGALATGLIVSAHAPDGTIEGIEDPAAPFFVGVQWHPEDDDDRRIFSGFVEAAVDRG